MTLANVKKIKLQIGKLLENLAKEITRNKICVDIIGTYTTQMKVQKKNPILKEVTMIITITERFEIPQYDHKRAIKIAKLVETAWTSRHP